MSYWCDEELQNLNKRLSTMKFVSRRVFIIGMILLLSISDINGAHMRHRRQADSDGKSQLDWQTIIKDVLKIPLMGDSLHRALVDLGESVNKLDRFTNGTLSRISNDYPPCTIDMRGVLCTGKPKNGGIVGITTELINDTMLPKLAKSMMINFLHTTVFPFFAAMFGLPEMSYENM